jgi:hypothetical protein
MNEKYRVAGSEGRKELKLDLGDLVWLHLRKERFPEMRKSKLMPRATGPYKIIEKINDNAYKLELPLEFGVSPTFNIADLTPYFGEEDEFESRTTPFLEGEDDEDITSSDAPSVPPSIMQGGPMTRAQTPQLNLEVSSFLSDPFYTFENRLLPNDVILIRNIGEGHEERRGSGGGDDDQLGRPVEVGGLAQHHFESASVSRTSLS